MCFKSNIILCLIILVSLSGDVYCQIENYSEYHNFNIEGDKVIEEIKIRGKITEEKGAQISIVYNGLEKISDVKLEYFTHKLKKAKQKDFIQTALLSNSFYDGINSLEYYISSTAEYTLSYKIERNDLMYISTLDFFTYYKCDNLSYSLNLPKEKILLFDVPVDIKNLKIDSVFNGEKKEYLFSLTDSSRTPLVEFKREQSAKIISDKTSKVVRVQISNIDNHNKALNDWYYKLVESTGELNDNSKKEIDQLLEGVSDKDSIAKRIFKFVQDKIRYLDIEDGVNAFVPRNVNDILLKRQGDCKDMSNLLVKSYNYKGIESHIALASSTGHRFKLDFPNIASANHVVCMIKKNNKWIIVDATDKYCEYAQPSVHMQGRNIFIINDEEGEYYEIEKIDYRENLDSTFADLAIINNKIIGKIKVTKKGLANRRYVAFQDYFNNKDLSKRLKKNIQHDYKLYSLDSLNYIITSRKSVSEFNISQRQSNLTVIKSKTYLPVNALLGKIHPFPEKIEKQSKLITSGAFYNKGDISLQLNKEFTLLKELDKEIKRDSFSFLFKMKKMPNNILMISYEIIIDAIEIEGEEIESYNIFNKELKSILNKSIIYDQKRN